MHSATRGSGCPRTERQVGPARRQHPAACSIRLPPNPSPRESAKLPQTHGFCITQAFPPPIAGVTGVRQLVRTVDPHDCPSACSLVVQVEKGHVLSVCEGDNPDMAGVIYPKVGRYGERVHHPEVWGGNRSARRSAR